MQDRPNSITVWGVKLKRLTFTELTHVFVFGCVLFVAAAAILKATASAMGVGDAFAGCFTAAIAYGIRLPLARGLRPAILFAGLVLFVGVWVRILSMLGGG
jgi:hypothetical protein